MWSCSRTGSPVRMRPCTGPTRPRRSAAPRCGSPGPRTSSTGAITAFSTVAGPSGRPAASVPARRRSGFPEAGWRSTTAAATRPRPARWASTPPAPCCCMRRTPRAILRRTPEIDLRADRRVRAPRASCRTSSFPTGIVETEDTFLVYYGAADTCTAVVEFAREELMESTGLNRSSSDRRRLTENGSK